MASDVFSHEMIDDQEIPAILDHSSMSVMENVDSVNDNFANMRVIEPVECPEVSVWNVTSRFPNAGDEELPPELTDEWDIDLFIEREEQSCEAELMDHLPSHYTQELLGLRSVQRFADMYGNQLMRKIDDAEKDARRRLEQSRKDEEAVAQTQNRISEIKKDMEDLLTKKIKFKKNAEAKVAKLQKEKAEVHSVLKQTNEAVKKKQDVELAKLEKLRRHRQWSLPLSTRRAQVDDWMINHGIKIVIPSFETEQSNVDDSITDASNDEFIVVVTNVLTDFPEREFKIRVLKKRGTGNQGDSFDATSVYPSFVIAFDVLKAANESQNFSKLLLDCKSEWRKLCISGDQTVDIFDSSASTLSPNSS